MMAGKNQAALAVCAQTKVIFPFKFALYVQQSKPSSDKGNLVVTLRELTRNLAELSPRNFAFEKFCSRSEREQRGIISVHVDI